MEDSTSFRDCRYPQTFPGCTDFLEVVEIEMELKKCCRTKNSNLAPTTGGDDWVLEASPTMGLPQRMPFSLPQIHSLYFSCNTHLRSTTAHIPPAWSTNTSSCLHHTSFSLPPAHSLLAYSTHSTFCLNHIHVSLLTVQMLSLEQSMPPYPCRQHRTCSVSEHTPFSLPT